MGDKTSRLAVDGMTLGSSPQGAMASSTLYMMTGECFGIGITRLAAQETGLMGGKPSRLAVDGTTLGSSPQGAMASSTLYTIRLNASGGNGIIYVVT